MLTSDAIWQEFLYALRDFSFGNALLEDDHENAPHVLAAERIKSGHFRRNLGSYSQQLLECVFEEGSRHNAGLFFAAAAGGQNPRRRLGFWRDMHDIVARKLSGFDGERAEAFHILIDTCRAWQIVAHEEVSGTRMNVRGRPALVWRETLGGLLIRLPRAMETLWKSYPCADPLVEEGVQICFDDTPGLSEALTHGRPLRRARHSDTDIDEVMNLAATHVRFASHALEETLLPYTRSHEARRARSSALRDFAHAIRRAVALRAVAEKYLENLETLKPLAGRIAYRTATIFESRPRHMQENWIFSYEGSTMKDEAKSEILFAHCRDLRSGAWFESRRAHVLQNLTLMNREIFLCARAHADVIAVNADGSVSTVEGGSDDMPFYNPGLDDATDALF